MFQKKGTQVEKIWPAFLATDPDSGQHIRHAVPPCIGSALACPLSFGHTFGAVCLRKRGGRMYGHVWYLPSGGKTKDGRAWIDLSSSCCFSALDDRPPVSMEVDQSKSAPRASATGEPRNRWSGWSCGGQDVRRNGAEGAWEGPRRGCPPDWLQTGEKAAAGDRPSPPGRPFLSAWSHDIPSPLYGIPPTITCVPLHRAARFRFVRTEPAAEMWNPVLERARWPSNLASCDMRASVCAGF